MEIQVNELLKKLLLIMPGVTTKGINEDQGSYFIFSGEDVITFNKSISISSPLETDFSCCVPAKGFFSLIKKLNTKTVTINLEGTELIIKAKSNKKEITAGVNIALYLELMEHINTMGFPEDSEWHSITPETLKGINLCMYAAQKISTKEYETCISIQKNHIVAGCNQRFSLYKLENKNHMLPFLLPIQSAIELVKFKLTEYSLQPHWIFFCTDDNVIFCSRRIILTPPDIFPDYNPLFNVSGPSFTLSKTFKNTINSVVPAVDGEYDSTKSIDVEIKDKKIKCKATGELGWISSSFKLEENIPEINFKINPFFLSDALKENVTFTYTENKVLLSTPKHKHIISLFRNSN